jgi:hypothetical protein
MYKPATLRVVTIALAGLFTYPCWAGHIPGHQDSDPVFPMPIPGREFFEGGGDEEVVFFVDAFGPVQGTIITNTRFDITYVSDGITPASDIVIAVSAPVDMQSREFHITGADLGFGSGSGTFTGTFETDELNGEVFQESPDFPTVIHLTIDSVAGGIRGVGFFQDSFINLDVIPVPERSTLGLLTLGIVGLVPRRCAWQRSQKETRSTNGEAHVSIV